MPLLRRLNIFFTTGDQNKRRLCKPAVTRSLLCTSVIVLIISMLTHRMYFSQQQPTLPDLSDESALAKHLYKTMLRTILNAKTLSYESSFVFDISEPNNICNYHIWLKKPNYFYLEAVDSEGNKATYIGDGDHAWIYWPGGRLKRHHESMEQYKASKDNIYLKYPAPMGKYSISHKMVYLGIGWDLTVIDPASFMGYTDTLESTIDRYRYHGQAKVGDEDCYIVKVVYMGDQRNRIFWISTHDLLPRKLRDVVKLEDGDIITEENWYNIVLNEEMPLAKFLWNPPSNWSPLQLPTWKDKVLKAGTLAPDFDLMTTMGRKLKLSDLRGKIVWLVFWRVGCPPCRTELAYLEQIYKKYSHLNFTVIGFNFSDSNEFVAKFLKENDLTFPTILDHSDEAIKTGFFTYGARLTPLSYLIDPNGTIQDVFAGESSDPNSEIVRKLQEMLGF